MFCEDVVFFAKMGSCVWGIWGIVGILSAKRIGYSTRVG
jgi:hypothetical protein